MNRYAAIDLGSNSTRLLVAEVDSEGRYSTLAREMKITRMGQGVDAARTLHPDALERVERCLADFAGILNDTGVQSVQVVATSAARDAKNRDELWGRVERTVGVAPTLLSGEAEAALSFRGATHDLPASASPPYAVMDIGGGSTEFILGFESPLGSISVDMGCVRFTERFIESDPPAAEELTNAIGLAKDYLTDVQQAIPDIAGARTCVGLAGTVSAAVRIFGALTTYDRDRIHLATLSRAEVEEVFREVATATLEERRATPGMEQERADVIVGGMCILVAAMRTFEFDQLIHSESDILDGMILAMSQ